MFSLYFFRFYFKIVPNPYPICLIPFYYLPHCNAMVRFWLCGWQGQGESNLPIPVQKGIIFNKNLLCGKGLTCIFSGLQCTLSIDIPSHLFTIGNFSDMLPNLENIQSIIMISLRNPSQIVDPPLVLEATLDYQPMTVLYSTFSVHYVNTLPDLSIVSLCFYTEKIQS